ncbi:hypothetical protein S245_072213 [Arachis hypogaea]
MASSSSQQNKQSPSTSTVISFFKIILKQALQDDDFVSIFSRLLHLIFFF